MQEFGMPLFGGLLIGLSASLLLLLIGKVAGISGILWGAIISSFEPKSDENSWRWLFLIGLIVGAWLFHFVSGAAYPVLEFNSSNAVLAIIAGLFVGVGVKLGSGCTSGHGVCGIGRLSLRSLTATIVFMLVAVMIVLLMRVGGLS